MARLKSAKKSATKKGGKRVTAKKPAKKLTKRKVGRPKKSVAAKQKAKTSR